MTTALFSTRSIIVTFIFAFQAVTAIAFPLIVTLTMTITNIICFLTNTLSPIWATTFLQITISITSILYTLTVLAIKQLIIPTSILLTITTIAVTPTISRAYLSVVVRPAT
jgi:hypothetical protein